MLMADCSRYLDSVWVDDLHPWHDVHGVFKLAALELMHSVSRLSPGKLESLIDLFYHCPWTRTGCPFQADVWFS